MITETTSVLLEIPSALHDQLETFLKAHPGCNQNAAYTAGLALLLTSHSETAIAARRHLDQLIKQQVI